VLVDCYGLLDPSSSVVGFVSNDLHPIPVNDVVLPGHTICDGLVLLFICGFLTYPCISTYLLTTFLFCAHLPWSLSSWLSLPHRLYHSSYRDLVYALPNFFTLSFGCTNSLRRVLRGLLATLTPNLIKILLILINQAIGYASQHILCLFQARINWEGCARKVIRRKNGGDGRDGGTK